MSVSDTCIFHRSDYQVTAKILTSFRTTFTVMVNTKKFFSNVCITANMKIISATQIFIVRYSNCEKILQILDSSI